MHFIHNNAPITKIVAYKHLRDAAEHQGMDTAELLAIFLRAGEDTEDGEYARDELSSVNDCVEIYIR